MRTKYYIMTSSDVNLFRQVKILLYSIGENLKDADVDFYFFHRGINVESIRDFAAKIDNISFYDVAVEKAEIYDQIASHGGSWAGEAYYSLCAYRYLPESVDRILYVDAGDVMIVNDIAPFYYDDFNDNLIITSNIRSYSEDGKPVIFFNESDLLVEDYRNKILDSTFNSGSYMININKFRDTQLDEKDYLDMANYFCRIQGMPDRAYFGDQGFMSACFLGDIKYWHYPEEDVLLSTAYNFMMGWYNVFHVVPFRPAIVHFVGGPKPWSLEYPYELKMFQDKEKMCRYTDLTIGQGEWYFLWHQYAMCSEALDKSR
ncbi:glycosyltransferase family 8 protein [Bilifractor sp. LCP21S3_A7]|uniref:glycosyltransferase family 8 protein n=1 Tax=Bilifractor sp. LCP21S3_A7 TaxID=3438738 RepID=UPI003F8F1AF3